MREERLKRKECQSPTVMKVCQHLASDKTQLTENPKLPNNVLPLLAMHFSTAINQCTPTFLKLAHALRQPLRLLRNPRGVAHQVLLRDA